MLVLHSCIIFQLSCDLNPYMGLFLQHILSQLKLSLKVTNNGSQSIIMYGMCSVCALVCPATGDMIFKEETEQLGTEGCSTQFNLH